MSDNVWSIVTLLGLLGWLSAAIALIMQSMPERGMFIARPARLWGAVLLAFYTVWVVGMLNA